MKRLTSQIIVLVVGVLAVVVLSGGETQPPSGWVHHPGNPLLRQDPSRLDGLPNDPAVLQEAGGYAMYYGAVKGDFSDGNTVRIFRATSPMAFNGSATWRPSWSRGLRGAGTR